MNKKNNTTDFLKNVHRYLDNALSTNESKNFIQDVYKNPLLAKILNEERNLRTTIKNKLQRPEVAQNLIDSIRDNIYS